MVYDSTHDRVIVFGGWIGLSHRFGDLWSWDGRTWTLLHDGSGNAPSPRNSMAMAYDSIRDRVVLYGGRPDWYVGDTWEFDCQTLTWEQMNPSTSPGVRGSRMVFDSCRGVVVLFGGWTGNSYVGDTWEWDGEEWTQKSTNGPGPRAAGNMAFDSDRCRTVLYGGDDPVYYGDTWEWDGESWELKSTQGPGPRASMGMAYDSVRRTVTMYGGWTGSETMADVWEWDGDVWTRSCASAEAGPRRSHEMAFDISRGEMVVFGGVNSSDEFLGDTWERTSRVGAIDLVADGTCPGGGPIRIEWSGATPNGQVALIFATCQGDFLVPPRRPCQGTLLGLGGCQIQVAWTGRSDGTGSKTLNSTAGGGACGGFLQLLDLTTCQTSNVAIIE